jgi:3-hydroxyacyl-CoA dehydrogenase
MSEKEIKNIVVAGAGTMGPGIAAVMAGHGYSVYLTDIKEDVLEKAKGTVGIVFSTLVREGFMSQEGADNGKANLKYSLNIDETLGDVDYVIETIPEVLEIKQAFYKDIESKVADHVILASNTSGIPVTKLGEVCKLPGRVIGMHWSNPPHIIPVIEVIQGAQTDDATVAATHALVKTIEMIPVDVLKDVAGFVENRILYAIMREALHLVESGIATAEAVDTITKWGIGYKLSVIGPMELLDMAGLDIYASVASYLNADLSNETGVSSAITDKVDAGILGLKTGGGLYEYGEGEIPGLMAKRIQMLLDVKKVLNG